MNLLSDLSNITDPLDFKNTKIPKLFEVDSLLRCHICKEFLSAPMLTSCGHSYCSVCIRKYLIHTPKCPICAKELRESNLSRNVLLEQVVISYKSLREDLLKNLEIPKEDSSDKTTQSTQKVIDVDSSINGADEDEDDDVIIIDEPKKRKPEANSNIDNLFKKHKPQDKNTGTCPICNKVLPLDLLQSTHIDSCLSNPQPANNSSSRSPTQQRESTPVQSSTPGSPSPYFQPKESVSTLKKLTKLDYSSLSDSKLKQRLSKLELPITGSRNQLENRYNEYLILWNANCDSVVPKNPKILRKQLAQWENSLKFKSSNGHKQLDQGGWGDLIAQAKRTALKNKQDTEEVKETEASTEGTTEHQESHAVVKEDIVNEIDEKLDTTNNINTEVKTSQEQFFE